MKYWFFAALLANAIYFLWEFHHGAFEPAESLDGAAENAQKQILLVSEAETALTQQAVPEALSSGSERDFPERHEALPESPQLPTQSSDEMQAAIVAAAPEQNIPPYNAPAETVILPEAPAGEQRAANANDSNAVAVEPAASSLTPVVEQATAEKTASTEPPATPGSAQMPLPAQISQTEQPSLSASEERTLPSESVTPSEPPAMEIAAPPETAQAAAQTNEADSVSQQLPVPSEPEILRTACYAAGPVENRQAFETLLGSYRPQLSDLEFSAKETRKNDSYTVYYPAEPTLEQSIATAEMLRSNHGIKDLLVFRVGELKGAISLGVFNNKQRAEAAQRQFESKGVPAEIRPRYPLEVYYAVRMRWNEQQAAAAERLSKDLMKRYAATSNAALNCN